MYNVEPPDLLEIIPIPRNFKLSMCYRQKRGELIFMYKIVNNYFNSNFSNAITFSTMLTRGLLVYVIGRLAVVFRINGASIVNRKE